MSIKASPDKLIYLESLRGLAALAVIFSHLIETFNSGSNSAGGENPPQMPTSLWGIIFLFGISYGIYAVRLFFFLSGFVLSVSYFRKRQISILESAAIKRYPRLVIPVLSSALFAWLLQESIGFRNWEAIYYMPGSGTNMARLYSQHISFLQAIYQGTVDVFFNPYGFKPINAVLWTMPIEFMGSFFVFAFLALFGRQHKRLIIYIIGALILHFMSLPYAVDFLGGMALADFFVQLEKSPRKFEISLGFSLLIITGGLLLGGLATSSVHNDSLIYLPSLFNMPTLASFFIVGTAIFSPRIQAALEHSVLAFIGRISFPLYLFHLPILCSLGCGFYVLLRTASFSHLSSVLLSSLLVVGVSLLVSWAAYYAVELPSIRTANKFSRFFSNTNATAESK